MKLFIQREFLWNFHLILFLLLSSSDMCLLSTYYMVSVVQGALFSSKKRRKRFSGEEFGTSYAPIHFIQFSIQQLIFGGLFTQPFFLYVKVKFSSFHFDVSSISCQPHSIPGKRSKSRGEIWREECIQRCDAMKKRVLLEASEQFSSLGSGGLAMKLKRSGAQQNYYMPSMLKKVKCSDQDLDLICK